MVSPRRKLLIAFAIVLVGPPLFAYGPTGHEIVGGIADKLIAKTPASEKIYALTDGITLERASTIADEIRAWDKNGVDDPNAFPRYTEHPKIDNQLREFWRANPPRQDPESLAPSHHWFHYTDVPILNLQTYRQGKTGRSQWDIVHMIAYCIDVLRGEIREDNPRKITKSLAVILLAHYVGDIHQPLHVGVEYFDKAGQAVDPDKNQPGIGDEGANLIVLRLFRGRAEEMTTRGLKLHGFWDNEAVMSNLPALPFDLTRDERFQMIEPAKRKMIDRLAKEEPAGWRAPAGIALRTYAEFWADEILPVAHEAHQRLRFVYMHSTIDQGRIVMAGVAREKNMPDHMSYANWSAQTVREELHKAGWRLADLLSWAVE